MSAHLTMNAPTNPAMPANQTDETRMKIRTLMACAAAMFAVACTSSGSLRPGAMPPYAAPDRITEDAIHTDYDSIEMLQLRLALLNRNGAVPTSNYNWAKAQCWLDMARHNYHENDRTGTIESAMQQSLGLIKGMEAKASIPMDTPLIPESVKIRDDLWAKAGAYKNSAQFSCVEPQVACFEVQLVWMGQEYSEGGWRHANPYIGIAEQMSQNIEQRLAACAPPPPPPAPQPVAERFSLGADALFAFDKSGKDDIREEGRARLDVLAAKVKTLSRIDSIVVTGYTDRLGSDAHNLPLSQRRADTVKAYLAAAGVPAGVIEAHGQGSANPVKECTERKFSALTQCLQPNRRVEIELRGTISR
jgi:outer membrane protein OmpA-like peptidoglycan-associated protein